MPLFGTSSPMSSSSSTLQSPSAREAVAAVAKRAIRANLVEAVKDLQSARADDVRSPVCSDCAAANALCAALEAAFVHGARQHSVLGRIGASAASAASAVTAPTAGGGRARLPETNFWLYVMIYTHGDTLRRIERLSQINGDVGRCRAWIRLALNEGLLGSYLKLMLADRRSCRKHYDRTALMRDQDALDVITKYVMGVEIYPFQLALNAGILNIWQTPPLVLAGLWVPENFIEAPPVEAIDVVSQLNAEEAAEAAEAADLSNLAAAAAASDTDESVGSSSADVRPLLPQGAANYLSRGLLNEDEALKLILQSTTSPASSSVSTTPRTASPFRSAVATPHGSFVDESDLSRKIRDRRRKERQKAQEEGEGGGGGTDRRDGSVGAKRCDRKATETIVTAVPVPQEDVSKEEPAGNCSRAQAEQEIADEQEENQNETSAEDRQQACDVADPDKVDAMGEEEVKRTEEVLDSSTASFAEESIYRDGEEDDNVIGTGTKEDKDGATEEKATSVKEAPAPARCLPRPPSLLDQILQSYEAEGGGLMRGISTTQEEGDEAGEGEEPVEEAVELKEGDEVKFEGIFPSAKKRIMAEEAEVELAVPRLSGFIESFDPFSSGRYFDTPPPAGTEEGETMGLGFTLQKDVSVGTLNVEDSQRLMGNFDKICREVGLDRQNYECADCSRAIGTIFGPAKTCGYTGRYLCEECQGDDIAVIPVRVVLNWDFRKRPIGRRAKAFLDAISVEPIVDAKNVSPALFEFAPVLGEVLTLRKKLNYMRAYLQTCGRHPEVYRRFMALVSGREYLINDVHKFAIKDFEQTKSGELPALLKSAYSVGETHILRCVLCSGKGFVCELCSLLPPIYPFHLETISQCRRCFNVFHRGCAEELLVPRMSCPRCERKEARNLNWHVNNVRCRRERRVCKEEEDSRSSGDGEQVESEDDDRDVGE